MHLGNTGVRPDLDVGRLLDLIDQVLRHRAGERFSSNQNDHPLGVFGEVHGGLPRRIGASNYVDNFIFTGDRFSRASAVINASTLQAVDSRRLKSTPLHAGSDHQSVTRNLHAIRQFEDTVRSFGAHAERFLWSENFYAKRLSLYDRPTADITTAESVGKS